MRAARQSGARTFALHGYPLLFAAGETADGVEPLIKRQHDLFMELPASYTHRLGNGASAFVAHRRSDRRRSCTGCQRWISPEAPVTHQGSTHITFGVVTAGFVAGDWKIESSQFRGREPDEYLFDIESAELDSTAARLSWNPTENLSLQASWADIESPEALEPDEDEGRWSVRGVYTRRIGEHGWWSTTLVFFNKERSNGVSLDAWLAEVGWRPNDHWAVFARGEAIETDELSATHDGPIEHVQRISLGAVRDFRLNEITVFGVGALV